MDVPGFNDVIAGGAMAIGAVVLYKGYSLITKEQEKDSPNGSILATIWFFLIVGIITFSLAIGLEVSKFNTEEQAKTKELEDKIKSFGAHHSADSASIVKEIKEIAAANYLTLDKNGIPAPIQLDFHGKKYTLSQALPQDYFKGHYLSLEKEEGSEHFLIKNKLTQQLCFGYLNAKDIESIIPKKTVSSSYNAAELGILGINFLPKLSSPVLKKARDKFTTQKSTRKFVRYLVRLIELDNEEAKELYEPAFKLLTESEPMRIMTDDQSNILIKRLSLSTYSDLWHKYQLAQVYNSRYRRDKSNESFKKLYKQTMKEFMEKYLEHSTVPLDTIKFSIEYGWYKDARKL